MKWSWEAAAHDSAARPHTADNVQVAPFSSHYGRQDSMTSSLVQSKVFGECGKACSGTGWLQVALSSDFRHGNELEWCNLHQVSAVRIPLHGSCSATSHDHKAYSTGPAAAWVSSRGSKDMVEGKKSIGVSKNSKAIAQNVECKEV